MLATKGQRGKGAKGQRDKGARLKKKNIRALALKFHQDHNEIRHKMSVRMTAQNPHYPLRGFSYFGVSPDTTGG